MSLYGYLIDLIQNKFHAMVLAIEVYLRPFNLNTVPLLCHVHAWMNIIIISSFLHLLWSRCSFSLLSTHIWGQIRLNPDVQRFKDLISVYSQLVDNFYHYICADILFLVISFNGHITHFVADNSLHVIILDWDLSCFWQYRYRYTHVRP